ALLAADPRTALAPIDVTTQGGEVTLSGTVTSPRVKQAAEEIARAVPGVVVVLNELRVETPAEKTGA
ncbi:MAG TPA: BON domain-containing protein, partial [Chloroflexota bacterium]|nr:BON domain-containing protein [Chloroflexota bacterium]